MSTGTRRREVSFTQADRAAARHYDEAKPDPLGDLHQRMKAVMELIQVVGHERIGNELWHAIWDLQTEVAITSRRPRRSGTGPSG
jgi:hypothetical protein